MKRWCSVAVPSTVGKPQANNAEQSFTWTGTSYDYQVSFNFMVLFFCYLSSLLTKLNQQHLTQKTKLQPYQLAFFTYNRNAGNIDPAIPSLGMTKIGLLSMIDAGDTTKKHGSHQHKSWPERYHTYMPIHGYIYLDWLKNYIYSNCDLEIFTVAVWDNLCVGRAGISISDNNCVIQSRSQLCLAHDI